MCCAAAAEEEEEEENAARRARAGEAAASILLSDGSMAAGKKRKRSEWTAAEAQALVNAVRTMGTGAWDQVSRVVPGRSVDELREVYEAHGEYLASEEASGEGLLMRLVDGLALLGLATSSGRPVSTPSPVRRSKKQLNKGPLFPDSPLTGLLSAIDVEMQRRGRKKVDRRKPARPVVDGFSAAAGPTVASADDGGMLATLARGEQAVRVRLAHCMTRGVRKWIQHEWFTPALDVPFLAEDEFAKELADRGLEQPVSLTRAEWAHVRAALGKPRRFSPAFLREERRRMGELRDAVRAAGDRKLAVGRRVTVRDVVTGELRSGAILTADERAFRVQFDVEAYGVALVRDEDIMEEIVDADIVDETDLALVEASRRLMFAKEKLVQALAQMNAHAAAERSDDLFRQRYAWVIVKLELTNRRLADALVQLRARGARRAGGGQAARATFIDQLDARCQRTAEAAVAAASRRVDDACTDERARAKVRRLRETRGEDVARVRQHLVAAVKRAMVVQAAAHRGVDGQLVGPWAELDGIAQLV